jgi:hypothetical protein
LLRNIFDIFVELPGLTCYYWVRLVLSGLNRTPMILYTIEKVLDDELPRSYSTETYRIKCERVYEHIYDNYYGAGKSIYSLAG